MRRGVGSEHVLERVKILGSFSGQRKGAVSPPKKRGKKDLVNNSQNGPQVEIGKDKRMGKNMGRAKEG